MLLGFHFTSALGKLMSKRPDLEIFEQKIMEMFHSEATFHLDI